MHNKYTGFVISETETKGICRLVIRQSETYNAVVFITDKQAKRLAREILTFLGEGE